MIYSLNLSAFFCITLYVFFSAVLNAARDEAERVVIVVNENFLDSVEIGEYYASKRGIPKSNIIRLKTSNEETITIQEYTDTIYNPLLERLQDQKKVKGVQGTHADRYGRKSMSVAVNSISYLVTIRGVPLRISNDPTLLEADLGNLPPQFQVNQASVDSELALLLAPYTTSMTALVPNPVFQRKYPLSTDFSRILRVSRLDGPDTISVKKLVDRTLQAEVEGLMGRAYFDIGGPHTTGDEWMSAAGELAESAYFDTDFETTKKRIDWGTRYEAPAIYMGWYRQDAYGPWSAPRWSVPPGAIGFHLHSFSATSLRDLNKGWLAAFVKQGYCATMGNVYEPYLDYTHRPQLLLEHLLEGKTFGEALMYSYPALSWMGIAIGDPLYQPFKHGLKQQLQAKQAGPFSTYATIREINRLRAEVDDSAAIAYARAAYVEAPTLALAYKLSKLYEANHQKKESVEALKIIRYITVFENDEQILVKQIADQLHKMGESALALEVYERLIAQRNLNKVLRIALLEGGAPVAAAMGKPVQSSRWNLEARQLKAPPQPKKPTAKK